jgi:hypothetical protein
MKESSQLKLIRIYVLVDKALIVGGGKGFKGKLGFGGVPPIK